MTYLKSLLCFLLMATIGQSYGQFQLTGRVLDQQDGTPLEQVSVYFPKLEQGAVTDDNGTFVIKGLPEGRYKLIVSYIGYNTYADEVRIGADPGDLLIELSQSAIEMQEVVVSTPFHQLQRDNVMKVEQKRVEELRANGAVTLAEGITQVPGVSTVSTGMGIGKPVIRGLSANRVLVYTQGIRLENQQFGDEHGLGINDAGIESIEVIKGPASLLYGSDALGGVLYLNPERFVPAGETSGTLDYNFFSNTNGSRASVAAATSGQLFKFLARATTVSHVDYETGGGSRVTNSRFRERDIKLATGLATGKFKTDIRYNYNSSELGIPEEVDAQTTSRTPGNPYQDLQTHIVSNTTEFFFNESSIKAVLGYTLNYRKEFEEEGEELILMAEELPALDMDLKTFSYKIDYQLPKFNRLETIIGIQGMQQENTNAGEEVLIPDATTGDIGVYANSHLHFDSSDLQLGIRFDRRNIDGEANGDPADEDYIQEVNRKFNSFNAAAGYRIDLLEGLIGRLNLATGFRAPNLAELTSNGVHEGTNRYEIGNGDLNNEKNFQTDLALEYQQEHLEFFVNAFYNVVNDFIYVDPTGETREENDVYVYRQQDARLSGAEIGFHLHPHPLDWLHLQSSIETVRGKRNNGENLPLIPATSWRNTLRVELANRDNRALQGYGFVTLRTFFDQKKVSTFESPTPGYSLLDIGIGGKFTLAGSQIALKLSATNLLDKEYIAHLSRLKNDGIANIGRNVMLGASIAL